VTTRRSEAEFIFRHHFEEGWSVSRIGRHLRRAHTTVDGILSGRIDPDVTADLRERFPAYEPRTPPTDEQLAWVFEAFYEKQMDLTEIGKEIGVRYFGVKRILKGEAFRTRTVDLRATYPEYRWDRDAISFDDEELARMFDMYHTQVMSLEEVGAEFGVTRNTVSALLKGQKGARFTEQLREHYGSEVRPAGRGGWTDAVAAS
jgi:hypothetical protein